MVHTIRSTWPLVVGWKGAVYKVALQEGLELPRHEGHPIVRHNSIRQVMGHKDLVEGPDCCPGGGRGDQDQLQPLRVRVHQNEERLALEGAGKIQA